MKKILANQIEIVNTIKLLIYKENPSLLEKVDFDDDNLFLEPILFVYFNNRIDDGILKINLVDILQGYFIEKPKFIIENLFNNKKIAYIPNIGYFKNNEVVPFENVLFIKNTKIEVIKYPVSLLNNIINPTQKNIKFDENIEIDIDLFDKNIEFLTNAFNFIKNYSVQHFRLIEQCCKKVLMFKTNPEKTNSFATINAHGVAFLNVYQEGYDEVFFVDDIAHQTGHIILTTLFYNKKNIFKANENQLVEDIIKRKDHRDIETLLHALYTYYTTLKCLNDCIEGKIFSESQNSEAIGRIGFYLEKCSIDFKIFDEIIIFFGGLENLLYKDGVSIYLSIKNEFNSMMIKWSNTTNYFDYSNQTYNFSFEKFNEINNTFEK